MSYTLEQASWKQIGEKKWATGHVLQFTPFTSCIGLVAGQPTSRRALIGIHLVMDNDEHNLETLDRNEMLYACEKVLSQNGVVCRSFPSITLFGHTDYWEWSESPEIRDFFGLLCRHFNADIKESDFAGARIVYLNRLDQLTFNPPI